MNEREKEFENALDRTIADFLDQRWLSRSQILEVMQRRLEYWKANKR